MFKNFCLVVITIDFHNLCQPLPMYLIPHEKCIIQVISAHTNKGCVSISNSKTLWPISRIFLKYPFSSRVLKSKVVIEDCLWIWRFPRFFKCTDIDKCSGYRSGGESLNQLESSWKSCLISIRLVQMSLYSASSGESASNFRCYLKANIL